MKKLFCLLFTAFICISVSQAQSYNKVRVTLKNGPVVKGSKATISDESIGFTINGLPPTYPLSEVRLVEAKKGNSVYWALGCGGGCALTYVIVIASNDPKISGYENSEIIPGAFILSVASAGVGVLIGALTDKYKVVYLTNTTSWINKIDLNFTAIQPSKYDPKSNVNLTLSYKF